MDAELEIKLLKEQVAKLEESQKEKKLKVDEKVKDFAEKMKLLKTNDFAVYHDDILNAYVMIVVDNNDPKIHLAKFIIKEMDEELKEDKNKAKEIKLDNEQVEEMEGLKNDKQKD